MVEALGAMTEGGAVGIGTAGERKVQRRKKEDTRRRECHPDTTTTTTCSSLSSFTSRRFSSLISFLVSSPSRLDKCPLRDARFAGFAVTCHRLQMLTHL